MDHSMRKQRVMQVYDALKEKGYNPVGQIVGYILTEDPTYITNHNGARQMISRIDREELLKDLGETERELSQSMRLVGAVCFSSAFFLILVLY